MTRKRRTRSHVIADLSTNFVEKQILLCNHAAQRIQIDYGFDLQIITFDEQGEIENGFIYLQLKATDRIDTLQNGNIPFQLESRDLEMWYNELYPVFVILYDSLTERAYWIDIQTYLQTNRIHAADLVETQDSLSVHFNPNQTVDRNAIEYFRDKKNQIHNFLFRRIEERGSEVVE